MESQDSQVEECEATGSESEVDWITLDEINALIDQAQGEPEIGKDGFYTSHEWAKQWGVSRQTASTKFRLLLEHDMAETRDVVRRSTRGYLYPSIAYRIKPQTTTPQLHR